MERRPGRSRNRTLTVERILAAAEKLFLEKGFRATSIQEIAQAAGYTTGAIYSSYTGKDDLFLAVYRRKAREQENLWRTALAEVTTPADAPQAMGSALTKGLLEPAWYAVIFEFLSYAARDDRLARDAADIYRSGQVLVAEMLGDIASASPMPIERLAQVVVGLLRGLALTWFIDPDAVDVSLFSDAVAVLVGATPR